QAFILGDTLKFSLHAGLYPGGEFDGLPLGLLALLPLLRLRAHGILVRAHLERCMLWLPRVSCCALILPYTPQSRCPTRGRPIRLPLAVYIVLHDVFVLSRRYALGKTPQGLGPLHGPLLFASQADIIPLASKGRSAFHRRAKILSLWGAKP